MVLKGKNVLTDHVEFQAKENSPGEFFGKVRKNAQKLGKYRLMFVIKNNGGLDNAVGAQSVSRTIRMENSFSVSNVEISMGEGKTVNKHSLKNVGDQFPADLTLEQHHFFSINFKITSGEKNFKPHGTLLKFQNIENNDIQVVEFAKPSGLNKDKIDMKIGLKSYASTFYHTSGKYRVDLLLGASKSSSTINWHLGDIELKFQEDSSYESDNESNPSPLPEIEHMFNSDATRAPESMWKLFTMLILGIPFLIVFIGCIKIGVNFSNFPSGLGGIISLLFLISYGSIYGLYTMFWIQMEMVEMFSYLSPLLVGTLYLGSITLRNSAKQRLSKVSKSKKNQ